MSNRLGAEISKGNSVVEFVGLLQHVLTRSIDAVARLRPGPRRILSGRYGMTNTYRRIGVGKEYVGTGSDALEVEPVPRIQDHTGCATTESIALGGAERKRNIVRRVREYECLVESALAREHDRQDDRDNREHDHKLDQCKPAM